MRWREGAGSEGWGAGAVWREALRVRGRVWKGVVFRLGGCRGQ
jgi:hypothetical protein